ncbi:MAG: LPXTG cell wall anchor domain-containing protein [Sporichthyaceae bacterium]|nr:LPXTG cell wall anchor domain-containing protein [Sporichthyaceae bacterium]
MIKTLLRAVVVTATLFCLGPALAGVAHADPIEPPVFEYPCPPEGCQPPPEPPDYEVNCPPLCLDDPILTVPFPCPPFCADPDPQDPIDPGPVEPNCPPVCPDDEIEVVCPPLCPDDGDDGKDDGDGGDQGENPGDEPTNDPGDEPTDDPTPDDGADQPQAGRLPHTGGPDLPLLLASGIGLIAAGGFGYLLVTRR